MKFNNTISLFMGFIFVAGCGTAVYPAYPAEFDNTAGILAELKLQDINKIDEVPPDKLSMMRKELNEYSTNMMSFKFAFSVTPEMFNMRAFKIYPEVASLCMGSSLENVLDILGRPISITVEPKKVNKITFRYRLTVTGVLEIEFKSGLMTKFSKGNVYFGTFSPLNAELHIRSVRPMLKYYDNSTMLDELLSSIGDYIINHSDKPNALLSDDDILGGVKLALNDYFDKPCQDRNYAHLSEIQKNGIHAIFKHMVGSNIDDALDILGKPSAVKILDNGQFKIGYALDKTVTMWLIIGEDKKVIEIEK
jgi:hypothetical protein